MNGQIPCGYHIMATKSGIRIPKSETTFARPPADKTNSKFERQWQNSLSAALFLRHAPSPLPSPPMGERESAAPALALPLHPKPLPPHQFTIYNLQFTFFNSLLSKLFIFTLIGCNLSIHAAAPASTDQTTLVLVVGAPGEEEFGKSFIQAAGFWQKAAGAGGVKCITIGLTNAAATNDLVCLQAALADEPKDGAGELWLVLLGHGTFDGKMAKFNLHGPDVAAADLATMLQPFQRPVAVINTASASAPFLAALSAPGRVVITATRSGHEQNYARFGLYLAEAIADPRSDLDQDGQTSLLEAFLKAANETAEFYRRENRLATEHPLLDDNGDHLGTPPDWFRGVRAIKKPKEGSSADGGRAHQFHLVRGEQEKHLTPAARAQRDALEQAIGQLRDKKVQMPEAEYYQQLEKLLLELAKIYETPSKP